jgi:hypothetical protein
MGTTNKQKAKKRQDTGQIMLEAMLASQQSTELMEMARHFFSLMGGPSGFARELHHEFLASKAGGLVRFKILDLVLQCQRFITPKDALKEELGLLTEADLERVHQEALNRYAKQNPASTRRASGEEDRSDPASHADGPDGDSGSGQVDSAGSGDAADNP